MYQFDKGESKSCLACRLRLIAYFDSINIIPLATCGFKRVTEEGGILFENETLACKKHQLFQRKDSWAPNFLTNLISRKY